LPLLACLTHNVNNALVGLMSHLELGLRDGADLRERAESALRCAEQLARRVRRLTAFTSGPPGPTARALVSLRQAATTWADRIAAEHPNVPLSTDLGADDCPVRADPVLLELVLEQLLCNALEAMPRGGPLTLRVWDEGPRRCLSIADGGAGFGPEVRKRLFEPFFTTKPFGHLGLGLALCRDALESQGGAIHLSSVEGEGTTAVLSFPPAPAIAVAPPHAAPATWTI
jgi:signal transduction histidine kinase